MPSDGASQSCGNCRFFLEEPELAEQEGGWCRRFPPTPAGPQVRRRSPGPDPVPRVTAGWWCGEWQHRPAPTDHTSEFPVE